MSVIRSGKVREKVNREKPTQKRAGADNLNKNQTQTYQMLLYVMPIFPHFPYICHESLSRAAKLSCLILYSSSYVHIIFNSKLTEMVSIHCY